MFGACITNSYLAYKWTNRDSSEELKTQTEWKKELVKALINNPWSDCQERAEQRKAAKEASRAWREQHTLAEEHGHMFTSMPNKNKGNSWKCVVCGMRTGTKCTCGAAVCKQMVKQLDANVFKECLAMH